MRLISSLAFGVTFDHQLEDRGAGGDLPLARVQDRIPSAREGLADLTCDRIGALGDGRVADLGFLASGGADLRTTLNLDCRVGAVPYVRTVKTASGATAVQIVYFSLRGSRDIEHIGSAHDNAGWSC